MDRNTPQRPLDRRQRKSREAIQNALLALLRDKPLDQITISELSAKADVNRKTFYNNYHSLQEVRDELDNRYLDKVFSMLEGNPVSMLLNNSESFFQLLFRGLYDNIDQSRLIFESGENICLSNRLKEITLPYLQRIRTEKGMNTAYLPFEAEYIDNGLSAIINTWLHSSPMLPPDEIATLAARIFSATILCLRE